MATATYPFPPAAIGRPPPEPGLQPGPGEHSRDHEHRVGPPTALRALGHDLLLADGRRDRDRDPFREDAGRISCRVPRLVVPVIESTKARATRSEGPKPDPWIRTTVPGDP